ncbi:hypothetical protein CDAR_193951 [Caerostris darwini]|uniref:Uncharacterized protein n=1 Tax=Caerostris darwini TaxID=1538125 RepID=A0AAV4PP12_9ARAC|nr:hypothetical protein CDAR_193951 [Caerostris darwini]
MTETFENYHQAASMLAGRMEDSLCTFSRKPLFSIASVFLSAVITTTPPEDTNHGSPASYLHTLSLGAELATNSHQYMFVYPLDIQIFRNLKNNLTQREISSLHFTSEDAGVDRGVVVQEDSILELGSAEMSKRLGSVYLIHLQTISTPREMK